MVFEAKINIERIEEHVDLGINVINKLFDEVIHRVTEGSAPHDLIRFCITSETLDKPISTSLLRVDQMTVEKVTSTVMKVMQSKQNIMLDENFNIDTILVRRPVGSGRHQRVYNIDVDRLKKRSILSVDNDEDFSNLCCAKAIVLAKAHEMKDPELKSLTKKDNSLLLRRAIKLHTEAGVPEGPCGYQEISRFENFLDTQIVVISAENMQKVCLFSKTSFLLSVFIIKLVYIAFRQKVLYC